MSFRYADAKSEVMKLERANLNLQTRLDIALAEVQHWQSVAKSLQDILDGKTKPIGDVVFDKSLNMTDIELAS